MKIAVAQDLNEFIFIQSKIKEKDNDVYWLPLDLDVFLYCYNNKLKFIDPINLVDNKFQQDAILSLAKLEKEIEKINFKYKILNKEASLLLRHYLSSVIFIYEVINKIQNLKSIYVSGWDIYEGPNLNKTKKKNYFITNIIHYLFPKKEIIYLTEKKKNTDLKTINFNYVYKFSDIKLSNKKNILMTNRIYNFKRIIIYFLKNKKTKCYLPFFPEDQTNLKDHLLNFIGIKRINFKKSYSSKKIRLSSFSIKKIKFKYKSKDLSDLANVRLHQLKPFFIDQEIKSNAVKKMLEHFKFDLVVSNFVRKTAGMFIENSIKLKLKSFCISHGTVSESYDKFDSIYKKIILDSVVDVNSDFIAAQSKLATKGLLHFKIKKNKILNTGNILFSENNDAVLKKKTKILYAVTNKNFFNIQFCGVEQYYEFFSNLMFLDSIAKNNDLEILVQIHPSYQNLKTNLIQTFKNLSFSCDNIRINLKKSFVAVSFSSSAIEDSLFSKVPVILLDRWKRYLHFKPKKSSKESVLYYTNKKSEFVNAINKVKKMKKYNFSEYIFEGKSNTNIERVFNKILKFEKNYV